MPKGLKGFQKGNKLGLGKHYNLGRVHSIEERRKQSLALKGKMPKNLSLINANKNGAGNPMWGKHPSKETLQKRLESIKKYWGGNIKAKLKAQERMIGENNPLWKGENVGYYAVHDWLKRKLGKARKCEFCGTHIGTFQWANKSHTYKRELDDWLQLCRKCHHKYDNVSIKIWETRRRNEMNNYA